MNLLNIDEKYSRPSGNHIDIGQGAYASAAEGYFTLGSEDTQFGVTMGRRAQGVADALQGDQDRLLADARSRYPHPAGPAPSIGPEPIRVIRCQGRSRPKGDFAGRCRFA